MLCDEFFLSLREWPTGLSRSFDNSRRITFNSSGEDIPIGCLRCTDRTTRTRNVCGCPASCNGHFCISGFRNCCLARHHSWHDRGRVTYHRIIGVILLYLLIALAFGTMFIFVGLAFPDAFRGITFERRRDMATLFRCIRLREACAISKASSVSFILQRCWRGL
jgi:hypothetical protein